MSSEFKVRTSSTFEETNPGYWPVFPQVIALVERTPRHLRLARLPVLPRLVCRQREGAPRPFRKEWKTTRSRAVPPTPAAHAAPPFRFVKGRVAPKEIEVARGDETPEICEQFVTV